MKIVKFESGLRFICQTDLEVWRAQTLWKKEPGTIRWINEKVLPRDVVFDVGANIGLYSVLLAKRVGELGHVYAFEPHPANVLSLLRNVRENGLEKIVTVVPVAVGSVDGCSSMKLSSLDAGSADNQRGIASNFMPTIVRLDTFGFDMIVNAVKIDIDGLEREVLSGMGTMLPRTMQVEVRADDDLTYTLGKMGYGRFMRHDTMSGEAKKATQPVAYNLVCEQC